MEIQLPRNSEDITFILIDDVDDDDVHKYSVGD